MIIGHRGASHDAPENTLAAFQLACAQGADAVELDVRLTQDNRLAVIHDPTTTRVAGVPGAVAQRTLAELRRLEVGRWGKWKHFGFTEPIPSLTEVIASIPSDRGLFIELKSTVELLCPLGEAIESTDPRRIAIIGFDYKTVCAAKRTFPSVKVCWLALRRKAIRRQADLARLIQGAQDGGLDGLDLEARFAIDPLLVQQVHGAGLSLYTWTVDKPGVAINHAASGVDGITTNRPGWLRQQLAAPS